MESGCADPNLHHGREDLETSQRIIDQEDIEDPKGKYVDPERTDQEEKALEEKQEANLLKRKEQLQDIFPFLSSEEASPLNCDVLRIIEDSEFDELCETLTEMFEFGEAENEAFFQERGGREKYVDDIEKQIIAKDTKGVERALAMRFKFARRRYIKDAINNYLDSFARGSGWRPMFEGVDFGGEKGEKPLGKVRAWEYYCSVDSGNEEGMEEKLRAFKDLKKSKRLDEIGENLSE